MTEEAKEARRAYARAYYAANPEKRKEYQARYWAKKAGKIQQKAAETDEKQEREATG